VPLRSPLVYSRLFSVTDWARTPETSLNPLLSLVLLNFFQTAFELPPPISPFSQNVSEAVRFRWSWTTSAFFFLFYTGTVSNPPCYAPRRVSSIFPLVPFEPCKVPLRHSAFFSFCPPDFPFPRVEPRSPQLPFSLTPSLHQSTFRVHLGVRFLFPDPLVLFSLDATCPLCALFFLSNTLCFFSIILPLPVPSDFPSRSLPLLSYPLLKNLSPEFSFFFLLSADAGTLSPPFCSPSLEALPSLSRDLQSLKKSPPAGSSPSFCRGSFFLPAGKRFHRGTRAEYCSLFNSTPLFSFFLRSPF